jgi:hypothetical protein
MIERLRVCTNVYAGTQVRRRVRAPRVSCKPLGARLLVLSLADRHSEINTAGEVGRRLIRAFPPTLSSSR